jgi:DNA-binding NarL/FixJ family response regulator
MRGRVSRVPAHRWQLDAAKRMSKSILIVDDSHTIRQITRLFLESQPDLEVCGEAIDGVEAIEKAKELRPDLILLDLVMPRLNGVEAAMVLKAMMPGVPIVMFTLYKESLGSTLTSAIGIDAVLSKPDGGWKMIECVRKVLQAATAFGLAAQRPTVTC